MTLTENSFILHFTGLEKTTMQTSKSQVPVDNDMSLETQPCSSPYSNVTFNDVFNSNAEGVPEHVLQTIIKHLNNFEEKLIDSELKLERVNEADRRIEQVLSRQLQDGLISYIEYINLNHVKVLWTSTSSALATHYLGCKSSRRQILASLIELYTLKEIEREELLDIVIEL